MKKGMNPESVEQMGLRTVEAGDEVMEIFSRVSDLVVNLDWTGEDRDRFVTEFTDQLGNAVQQVRSQCEAFSERAAQNATAQRDASS